MIKENLAEVEAKIAAACKRAGRDRGEVTLITVSKTNPVIRLKEAMDCGIHIFGENKVQEMIEKQDELPDTLEWHMIGHLQRNKVKYIMGKVAMIHSVDSLRLAEEISKEAVKHGTQENILIEINVAEEESKFGITTKEAIELVETVSKLPNIHIKGLMTIAPFVENAEENRKIFRDLKKLSVDIAQKNIDNVTMTVLSMGMTNDYEVAIEEGATMVRVGTGIFGRRSYTV